MRHSFKKRWYLFIPLGIAAAIAFGFIVMALWNYTMPGIFHLPVINFWQAIALLILSRIFFGSGPGHKHHAAHHGFARERWDKMSPEEREKFYAKFRNRCRPEEFFGEKTENKEQ